MTTFQNFCAEEPTATDEKFNPGTTSADSGRWNRFKAAQQEQEGPAPVVANELVEERPKIWTHNLVEKALGRAAARTDGDFFAKFCSPEEFSALYTNKSMFSVEAFGALLV